MKSKVSEKKSTRVYKINIIIYLSTYIYLSYEHEWGIQKRDQSIIEAHRHLEVEKDLALDKKKGKGNWFSKKESSVKKNERR